MSSYSISSGIFSHRSRYSSSYSSESESNDSRSGLQLSWNERDAGRSISLAISDIQPINIANITENEQLNDPEVMNGINEVFGPPQCSSAVASSGIELALLILLIVILFFVILYCGPYFGFSSFFFITVLAIFALLAIIVVFWGSTRSKGPICCR